MQADPATRIGVRHEGGVLNVALPGDLGEGRTVYETCRAWQMVPERLFRREDCGKYFSASTPKVEQYEFAVVRLPSLGAVGVFPEGSSESADSGVDPHHVAELFLAAADTIAHERSGFGLAFFVGQVMWLLLHRDGQVVFFSSQHVDVAADAVFFLAAHYQHFGLDRVECPVYVGGAVSVEGELHRKMSIYFDLIPLEGELHKAPPASNPSTELLLAYSAALRQDFIAA